MSVSESSNSTSGKLFASALMCGGATALLFVLLGQSFDSFGTWAPLSLSLGPLALGAMLWFYFQYASSTPGVKHNGTFFSATKAGGWIAWVLGIGITAFYVVLYFYDDLQAYGMPAVLDGWIAMLNPLAHLLYGGNADRWFLYGAFYTFAILIMGIRMLWRYRGNRYQILRTISVMFFQLGFSFLVPAFLKRINQPEFYFTYFWPLKPEYFFPNSIEQLQSAGSLGTYMVIWGIGMTFVATPFLSYFFGKRWYCSWVCGCGGLAETLGDPWRQNSSTSETSWVIERWMIHLVLVAIVGITAMLWINEVYDQAILGSATASSKKWYGFYIGSIFSGVIGVGFYPIMGSRVWCRFGCPMAAILGLFQRTLSRFRITVNGDQCISCGNCSTYCEMGIDVRGYAQRGENIVRSSCVGCGVCAAVCPRGVLKLENGTTHKDRFPGSEQPLKVLKTSLIERRIYRDKGADC